MPVAQKSAISFGLVYIPVELYTATQDNDVRFNQLTKDNHKRVRYVKTCAGCKKELKPEDIVKGFQYEKDKYVVVSDADFEKIKTEKDRSIQILQFADLSSIPPVYFEKSYLVQPQKGGEKPFALLRSAMRDEGKVAIGKTVMGNKETILALVPTDAGVLLQTLFFHDEVKALPKQVTLPDVGGAELDIAKQLVQGMAGNFDPAAYKDEYQEKLRDLISRKIEGKEVVAEQGEKPSNVINLMDALKESLKQQQQAGKDAPKSASKQAKSRKKTG